MIGNELNIIFADGLANNKFVFEIKPFDQYEEFHSFFANNARAPAKERHKAQIHTHSVMTYARLYIPEIFDNINKAIFLDCDLIFQHDINQLFKHDTSTNTMFWFVFPNDTLHDINVMVNNIFDERGDQNIQGFNAGLFLFNLSFWRQNEIREKAEDIIRYNKYLNESLFDFGDQSILHIIFIQMGIFNKIGHLDHKWNVLHLGVIKTRSGNNHRIIGTTQITKQLNEAYVLHYSGRNKPWIKSRQINYRLWLKYLPKKFNSKIINNWNTYWVSSEQKYEFDESLWNVNWDLIDILYTPAVYQLKNISEIISWKPIQQTYECVTVPPYTTPQMFVLPINETLIWIFIKTSRIKLKRRYVLCAFNDGHTVISNRLIQYIHELPNYYLIECNIPFHLSQQNDPKYTNVSVSIVNAVHIDPILLPPIPICANTKSSPLRVAQNSHLQSTDLYYSDDIHIFFSCDASEKIALYTAMNSIIIHHISAPYNNNSMNVTRLYFHILIEYNDKLYVAEINTLFKHYIENNTIKYEIKQFANYPKYYNFYPQYVIAKGKQSKHIFKQMNFARFYFTDIFDLDLNYVKKAIYLDVDIVFQSDIQILYDYTVNNTNPIQVPITGSMPLNHLDLFTKRIKRNKQLLDIPIQLIKNGKGFCGGIYLYDINYWINNNLTQKYEYYMKLNYDNNGILWNLGTQPLINILFIRNNIGRIPNNIAMNLGFDKYVNKSTIKAADILHYNGPFKPWAKNGFMAYKNIWLQYVPKAFNMSTILTTNVSAQLQQDTKEWKINNQLLPLLQNTSSFSTLSDVSHIISWNPKKKQNYYCGSQHYPQTLNKADVNYLQIQDIVLQTDQKSIWIFVVSYNLKNKKKSPFGYKNRYFVPIVKQYKHLLCAYYDGSTVMSRKINTVSNWAWYAVVECDIPLHLIPTIISANEFTSVAVSIINPLHMRQSKDSKTSIDSITVPICSKWRINSFNHIHNSNTNHVSNTVNTMWNSIGYTDYKYNLSACVIIQPQQMEYYSLHYDRYDQSQFILRDWIEYNLMMLDIDHFIFYQHFLPSDTLSNIEMQQSIVYDVLYPYIEAGKVTYIEWYNEMMAERTWQYSFENSCLRRFGHTKFSKYIMFLDVDEYIIPQSNYQHLNLLDLIHKTKSLENENKNDIFEFQVTCNKAFSCAQDMGCTKQQTFDTVLQRHACIAGKEHSTKLLTKSIVEAEKVKLMYTHYVEMFTDNKNKSSHTMNLTNVLCLHAKSNILIINDGMLTFSDVHKRQDIDDMTHKFTKYITSNSTVQQTSLLPLYQDNSSYCTPISFCLFDICINNF